MSEGFMERPEDTDRRLDQAKEPAVADDATAGYLENPWDPETQAKQKKARRPKARVRGKRDGDGDEFRIKFEKAW
jgi:hypothetical protein